MVFTECMEASGKIKQGMRPGRGQSSGSSVVLRPLQGIWLVIWRKQGSQHRAEMWCISCNLRLAQVAVLTRWRRRGGQWQGQQLKVQCWAFPMFHLVDKAALSQEVRVETGDEVRPGHLLKVKPIGFADEQNLRSENKEGVKGGSKVLSEQWKNRAAISEMEKATGGVCLRRISRTQVQDVQWIPKLGRRSRWKMHT